jgi:uncharacterized protein (DUF1330 family)
VLIVLVGAESSKRVARSVVKCAALKNDLEDSMAKKGYWVVCYNSVPNPAAFSEYAKLAATALEISGGRVIVGGKPAKTHEEGVDQSVVIVEFEELKKAIAAYESDLYRQALKALDNAAQRDFRIVEGR